MKLHIMTSLLFALMIFSGAQPIIAGDDNPEATDKESTVKEGSGAVLVEDANGGYSLHMSGGTNIDCQKDPDRCHAVIGGHDDPGPSEPAPENSTAENSGESKAHAKLIDMKKNHPEAIKKMSKEEFLIFLEKHRPSRTTADHAGKPTAHAKPGHVNKPRQQPKPRQRPQRRPVDK